MRSRSCWAGLIPFLLFFLTIFKIRRTSQNDHPRILRSYFKTPNDFENKFDFFFHMLTKVYSLMESAAEAIAFTFRRIILRMCSLCRHHRYNFSTHPILQTTWPKARPRAGEPFSPLALLSALGIRRQIPPQPPSPELQNHCCTH